MPQVLTQLSWQTGIQSWIEGQTQHFGQGRNEIDKVSSMGSRYMRLQIGESNLDKFLAEPGDRVKHTDLVEELTRQRRVVQLQDSRSRLLGFHARKLAPEPA